MSESFLESVKSLSSSGIDLSKMKVRAVGNSDGRVLSNSVNVPTFVWFLFGYTYSGSGKISIRLEDKNYNIIDTIVQNSGVAFVFIYKESNSLLYYGNVSTAQVTVNTLSIYTGNWGYVNVTKQSSSIITGGVELSPRNCTCNHRYSITYLLILSSLFSLYLYKKGG